MPNLNGLYIFGDFMSGYVFLPHSKNLILDISFRRIPAHHCRVAGSLCNCNIIMHILTCSLFKYNTDLSLSFDRVFFLSNRLFSFLVKPLQHQVLQYMLPANHKHFKCNKSALLWTVWFHMYSKTCLYMKVFMGIDVYICAVCFCLGVWCLLKRMSPLVLGSTMRFAWGQTKPADSPSSSTVTINTSSLLLRMKQVTTVCFVCLHVYFPSLATQHYVSYLKATLCNIGVPPTVPECNTTFV